MVYLPKMYKVRLENFVEKKHLPLGKQSGQILIIFLLVLVVGLAIVLSVASRSITDIRLTTSSDESNRAYFAAEAGVEEALKRLETDPNFTKTTLDFSSINNTTAKVSVANLAGVGGAFEFEEPLARDDVAQISLLKDFNVLCNGGPPCTPVPLAPSVGGLKIYWGNVGSTPTPAIEVSILTYDGTNFELEKVALDHAQRSSFCGAPDVSSTITTFGSTSYQYNATIGIRDGSGVCGQIGGISATPVLARFRMLYNTLPQPLAVEGDGWPLPSQGTEIESTGSTASGVTRKLKVIRQFPALPAIFDYVLFSGTDLFKN